MATRHLTLLSRIPKFPELLSRKSTPRPSSLAPSPSPRRASSAGAATTVSMAKKALVPIANGTEPLEAVIIIDVLRRSGAEVTVASVEDKLQVDACHGVKLVADALIADCAHIAVDLISLPGGMPGAATLRDCGILEGLVKKQAADGRLYSAICAAPAVALGSWGLLKGLKATCYPSLIEQLSGTAEAVESRVQQDGRVVTSRGPGTAMEYSVALVEQLYGKEKADEVAGPLVFSPFLTLTFENRIRLSGPGNSTWNHLVMRDKHGVDYTITELNPMPWTYDTCPRILVPIANGSEEMEAVIIIDVLRRAKANVVVASVDDKLEIVASRKVKIVADTSLAEAAKSSYDLIVLPGGLGGAQAFANSEKLVNMLKKQSEANRPYGAICASPALVLEAHGLLKGKKATAFPAMCEKLTDKTEIENRVVVDGNLITSRGPGTSMEFALAIVEKFFGREKAQELAKTMLFKHP
ncbi:DJ-1/PfpI [Dillenia turbinata]|uniref:DJ-1/PfpI n=1 Tax=Dillenia turbinata TaxID=194707 RepID=A0AAN8W5J1_9MAGN